jgi:hypothetical protein
MLCRVHLHSNQHKQYVILVKYDYSMDHNFYATSDAVYIMLCQKPRREVMPDYSVLAVYIALHIFTVFQSQQTVELAAENNPSAKKLQLLSSLGMLGEYIYPIFFIFVIGPWYWGVGMYFIGLIVSAVVFNIFRGFLPLIATLGMVFLGFLGVPACIAGLVYLSIA